MRHAPPRFATTAIEWLGHHALRTLAVLVVMGAFGVALAARRLHPVAMGGPLYALTTSLGTL